MRVPAGKQLRKSFRNHVHDRNDTQAALAELTQVTRIVIGMVDDIARLLGLKAPIHPSDQAAALAQQCGNPPPHFTLVKGVGPCPDSWCDEFNAEGRIRPVRAHQFVEIAGDPAVCLPGKYLVVNMDSHRIPLPPADHIAPEDH